ncbi:DUF4767 domain-containing protein [Limosilactobacillus reuteri]|uniref:DUF4767 domain-containing protein n=1 Tax=Limosilactobacillus reuteri TaxID=1598 RepID=UPI001E4426F2|nr:DUF4767 domain-containing protein [Limosilactobacillus reuteri]MCC4344848.1 DUF4767 domain-containing protein [Limosilactobacillus reuteri]MCC4357074.1 DUF4767 domain-containing protein [Limosilactobacillus reuteri]WJK31729.1 DUF4767 domain-containing protein [Limosilactobacillus reuteri]
MKKKLYKAKKNWVIGIIISAVFGVSTGITVKADSNPDINNTISQSINLNQLQESNRQEINQQIKQSVIPQNNVQQSNWSPTKDQQLNNYINQYGQQHEMTFQKYDGSTSMPIDGDYPMFDITKVQDNQNATIGYSKTGNDDYDYNVIAIYNHYQGKTVPSEFHDTYWFAFHNNQPVVLEDSTTNGGTVWLNNEQAVREWDSKTADNMNNFQAAFTQIANSETIYDIQDQGNYAWLDNYSINNNGQLNISGWHATNKAINKKYRYTIILNGENHQEIARKNITDEQVERNDVAGAHDVYNAAQSGFNVHFDLANVIATTPSIQVIDRYTDDPAGNGNAIDYWFTPFNLDHGNYGNLDNISVKNNQLQLSGWHANNATANKKYHYIIVIDKTNNNRELTRQRITESISRPDVAKVYPGIYQAEKSGFDVKLTASLFNFNHQLQVVDRYTDDPAGNGNAIDYWFAPFGGEFANQGWVDDVNLADGNNVQISGWHANDVTQYEQNHFIILYDQTANRQVAVTKATSSTRLDVAKAYPNIKTAGNSGYRAKFDLTNAKLLPGHSYSIVSRYSTALEGNGDQGAYTDYWSNPFILNTKANYLDQVQMTKDGLKVAGWMVDDNSLMQPNAYVIVLNNGKEIARQQVKLTARPDVAKVYPGVFNSLNSGFNALLRFDPQLVNGNMQVLLRFSADPLGNNNYSDQISNNYSSNAGSFDQIDVNKATVSINGWHASNQSVNKPYQYLIALGENGQELARWKIAEEGLVRPDVAKAIPYIFNSGESGYRLSIDIPNNVQHHTVRFIHRYTDDPAGNGDYSDIYSNPVMVNNLMRTPIDYRLPSEYAPYPDLKTLNNFWIHVKIGNNRVYLMNNNDVVYTMYCTAGYYDHGVSTTPTGTFHIQNERGNSFFNRSLGEGANHWTSFLDHGVYLFHTVPTDAYGNYKPYEASQLGINQGSHGCIRLSIPDAAWIQYNVPTGTKVVIDN